MLVKASADTPTWDDVKAFLNKLPPDELKKPVKFVLHEGGVRRSDHIYQCDNGQILLWE